MNIRILPILALLAAIGIFFWYVNPTWTVSIAATKAAIASDNEALIAADAFVAQQNQLIAARDAIDPADLVRLAALLPDSVDNVGLILDLNALAARSGVSLSNIDVASDTAPSASVPTSRTNPLSSVDLALTVIGSYQGFQAFLSGVEKSQRLLDVRDITIKGSDTGVYNYQMKLRLYWLQ